MNILIIVEHDNNKLKSSVFNLISAAKKIDENIENFSFFIAGHNTDQSIIDKLSFGNVFIAQNECYEHLLPEELDDILVSLIKDKKATHVLFPSSTFGKNLAPRIAAKLDINQLSDVVEIISQDTFIRPIYAGNAFATCKLNDDIKLLTIRSTAFELFDISNITNKKKALNVENSSVKAISKFIKEEISKSDRPELAQAKIVVSGGRGLQSKENFKIIEELAKELNAAIGATRAAVDAGFVPNDYQVGQTGKIVAPELYIAIGISGAIQHLAGIKDSKIIVAINKDPDAPIMQVADYALEADLFDAVPKLCEEIKKLKKN